MNEGCPMLPLASARAGMVLSDVLLDANGNTLLAEGTVLTEAMLASLQRHGVDGVPVVRAAPPAPPPDPAAVQARLDYLFRGNDRDDLADWATGILRRYVEDYRLRREVAP